MTGGRRNRLYIKFFNTTHRKLCCAFCIKELPAKIFEKHRITDAKVRHNHYISKIKNST